MSSLLISNAAEVLTCARNAPDLIGRIPGGSVLIEDGRIRAVGELSNANADKVLDATGKVVMPGFVDSHTHVVFGGNRAAEYAARVAGQEPPEDQPVGILGTMTTTRNLSVEELVAETEPRLWEMLAHGTTTVESKSGYGLTIDSEMRLLRANRELEQRTPMTMVGTYLGAHELPPDVPREEYVDQVLQTIPMVAEENLAAFCDAYCDAGYFTIEETRHILEKGLEYGLKPKLHLDAYSNTGAADLAAALGAVSVDHLNYTTEAEIKHLATAGCIGVAMPALDFSVGHTQPVEPRRLMELGMRVALATDICPGCWVASMQVAIQLGCRICGLSAAQALRAATLEAAAATAVDTEVGSLEEGKSADVIILDVPRHEDVVYRIGHNAVETVVKAGKIVIGGTS